MTYTADNLTELAELVDACRETWGDTSLTIERAEVIKPDGTYVGEVISNLDGSYEFRPVQR